MATYKVLIVDDQPVIREGIRGLLDWEGLGFHIAGTAQSGKAALEFLEREPCDLILSDIRMPDMNGIELIRQVRERGMDAEVIVISAYREFEYAKEAMQYGVNHYLLKPISVEMLTEAVLLVRTELQEAEKRRRRESERQMLKLLIASDSVPQGGRENGILRDLPYYCLALLHLNTFQEQVERLFGAEEDEITSEDVVMSFLSAHVRCFATSLAENEIAILFMPEENDAQALRILMSKLAEHLELYAGVCTQAVLGEIVSNIQELTRTYRRIVMLMNHERFWKHEGTLVMAADAADKWEESRRFDIEPVLNAVRSANTDAAMRETRRLIARFHALRPPVSQMRILLSEIMFKLTAIVMEMNHDANQALRPYGYHEQLYRISDVDELAVYLNETVSELCNYLNHAAEKGGQVHISEVADYIREHYAENITVKKLAERFYISPVYLGRLFAKKQGVSLNNFVNNVRIEKAKYMLAESDMKVYAVCSAVGYKSIKYFYKIFKDVTEMTPHEYRLIHREY